MSSKPIKRLCPVCGGEVDRKPINYMMGQKSAMCHVCDVWFPYSWSNPKIFAGLIKNDPDICEYLKG